MESFNMKTFLSLLVVLALSSQGLSQTTDTLTILHLNDTHGNLSSGGPRTPALKGTIGGLARAATVIGMTRLQDPSAMLLHAGDFFIGDLSFNAFIGIAEMRAMQSLSFDAVTMGNHEFDLAPAGFFFSLGQSGMTVPVISSNCIIRDSLLLPLKQYINSCIVKDVKGVKVGIFGMTSPEANLLSMAQPQAYLDTRVDSIAAAVVNELRSVRGCQVVIMLSHLGLELDRMLAAGVPGIDAVISAHDHLLVPQSEVLVPTTAGTRVPVAQAGAFYHSMGRLRLTVSNGKASCLDWTPILLDQSVPESPQILGSLDTMQTTIEAVYGAPLFSQRVATVQSFCKEQADSLRSVGAHDTPVGNLVTDAFRAAARTDIALTAGGSTAQPLYKGPIIANDIMRMIGYGYNEVDGLGFRIVTFDIPGAAVYAGLQYGLSNALRSGTDEFLVQVSGMKYDYVTKLDLTGPTPVHDGTIVSATIAARPLDPTAMYSVTVNEFVFNIFLEVLKQMHLQPVNVTVADSVTEFQVVTNYAGLLGSIAPSVEGRIRCVSSVNATEPRALPTGVALRHYPNPVRQSATIVFDLPAPSRVSITVFDQLGRMVADLLQETKHAGTHEVVFNTGDLPAGMYQYFLTADGIRIAKSLAIVR
jgi:5'-nucleotidase / UDP-sugar diphosphatase